MRGVRAAERILDGEDGWASIKGEGKGITHYKPEISRVFNQLQTSRFLRLVRFIRIRERMGLPLQRNPLLGPRTEP